uniref:Tubulin-specific chaperone e n=1 Tax=Moniliophthora roreri TaxID=221103 RepID=A0A0W0FPT5_MONRR
MSNIQPRIPNAGSFIRPTANVHCGISFLQGLSSKYVEAFHGSASQEKVVLGSSNGAIEVEAVNLDKIRGKFSDLERLREVSLENELIARADPPGMIRKTCPNIRGLNISTSLLPSWSAVIDIAAELPSLQRLALNRNRLELLLDPQKGATAFNNLLELELNGTLTTWSEFQKITAFMPRLHAVEMGYNRLGRLTSSDSLNSPIQCLNLDTNELSDWNNFRDAAKSFPRLERVIMASNHIASIPCPATSDSILGGLASVFITSNQLSSWKDIDALSLWCPALQVLSLAGNPLVDDPESQESRYSRQFTIARIPTLVVLDSATISLKERTDSELFYLSYISQHFDFDSDPPEKLLEEHPQWDTLCRKHGVPDRVRKRPSEQKDKLSSKLFEVQIYRTAGSTPSSLDKDEATPLRVLPMMTLKTFRLKVRKLLKLLSMDFSLWLQMPDGEWVELGPERDQQDLDWLGLENGSHIACCTH